MMFYIQTGEFLMQAQGVKRHVICSLGPHKVAVYIKGNFKSFIVIET